MKQPFFCSMPAARPSPPRPPGPPHQSVDAREPRHLLRGGVPRRVRRREQRREAARRARSARRLALAQGRRAHVLRRGKSHREAIEERRIEE
jgi:hypothetical protein